MRDGKNIREVAQLHPHYMGFIFYATSPRFVGNDFKIPKDFPKDTQRVGVFVNETNEVMLQMISHHQLDYVQLHGNETVEQCRSLKQSGVGVIKVFSVDESMDFAVTIPYQEVVDFFLFDTKGKYFGGNARTFDWKILKTYDQKIPFFLSGGITPENIREIVDLAEMNLEGIDVNSGVEIQPALKDVSKVRAIKSVLISKTLTNEL